MKKLLVTLITLAIVLTSCSSEADEPSVTTNSKLLLKKHDKSVSKSTGEVYSEETITYTYDDKNRLIKSKVEPGNELDSTSDFIYENNKLSRISFLNINEVLTGYVLVEYLGDKIAKLIQYDVESGVETQSYISEFTYDAKGKITKINEKEYYNNQWGDFVQTVVYEDENKVKLTNSEGDYTVYEYEAIDKKTPFYDLAELKPLLNTDFEGYTSFRVLKKATNYFKLSSDSNSYEKTNTFDNDNFLKEIKSESDYEVSTITFEYNK